MMLSAVWWIVCSSEIHHAGGEALIDEAPVTSVQGRVHVEHHEPQLLRAVLGHLPQERRLLGGGEVLVIPVHVDAVVVLGDAPEPGPVGLLVPVHRRLATQLGEPMVRDGGDGKFLESVRSISLSSMAGPSSVRRSTDRADACGPPRPWGSARRRAGPRFQNVFQVMIGRRTSTSRRGPGSAKRRIGRCAVVRMAITPLAGIAPRLAGRRLSASECEGPPCIDTSGRADSQSGCGPGRTRSCGGCVFSPRLRPSRSDGKVLSVHDTRHI